LDHQNAEDHLHHVPRCLRAFESDPLEIITFAKLLFHLAVQLLKTIQPTLYLSVYPPQALLSMLIRNFSDIHSSNVYPHFNLLLVLSVVLLHLRLIRKRMNFSAKQKPQPIP